MAARKLNADIYDVRESLQKIKTETSGNTKQRIMEWKCYSMKTKTKKKQKPNRKKESVLWIPCLASIIFPSIPNTNTTITLALELKSISKSISLSLFLVSTFACLLYCCSYYVFFFTTTQCVDYYCYTKTWNSTY